MQVYLPDGSSLSVAEGATMGDVAEAIGPGLARAAVAGRIGEERKVDLATPVSAGDRVAIITLDSEEGLEILRHSAAHVLAEAAMKFRPGTNVGIGPAIEDGFYYDFQFPEPVGEDDLPALQEEIERSVAAAEQFRREELGREEALQLFGDQPFKQELIRELPEDETISVYRHGNFVDLCRGPHLPDTGRIPAVRVLSVAGAYWKGKTDNPMLTRIYGTAFPSKKELKQYLDQVEMAKERDHRRLGKELGLFSLHKEAPGFPFFHPRGTRVIRALLDYWRREHEAAGYEEIQTPIILQRELWEESGHWDNYRDEMYFTEIDDEDYAVKPMNCPGGILIYRSEQHSYRDLPLRLAELGTVHRHELSGVLHGLLRVRSFTQDDAHIYCLPEQVEKEVMGVVALTRRIYRTFGFEDVELELSTRPEKSIGSPDMWEQAEQALAAALERSGLEYRLNPGDGAFYGPKIDFHIRDVMGRTWQCATCQLDFALPERFELEYVGEDNQRHRPVMIHRTVLGSIERFLGILIEHYGGAFPAWLAPVQVVVISVADRHAQYSRGVVDELLTAGVRAEADQRNESVKRKIRDNELAKIPFMLVVGDAERDSGTLSLRSYHEGDLGSESRADIIGRLVGETGVPSVDSISP